MGRSNYAAKEADNPTAVLAALGRFTIVEGKVVSVRESGGTIYVNFGRRWSEDFTVTISKRNERSFAESGLVPKSLAGRRVRVRGVIEERGGPWIEAVAPGQSKSRTVDQQWRLRARQAQVAGLGAFAVALALAGCSSLVQTDHAMVLPGSAIRPKATTRSSAGIGASWPRTGALTTTRDRRRC